MAWTAPRTWAVGEIVTAAYLNAQIRDNMKLLWRELSYTEFTSNVSVTATSAASPNDVVSSGAVTYEAKPIRITFQTTGVQLGSTANAELLIHLWDGSTDLGRLALIKGVDGTETVVVPVQASRKLTPSAGSHTYKVTAYRTGSDGTIYGGAGGAGTTMPGFLRIEAAES